MTTDTPKRGVYFQRSSAGMPIGALRFTVYDSAGVCIVTGTAPDTKDARAELGYGLWAALNIMDPVDDEAEESESDRVRALLTVSEGGNKPPRGRPRARRRLGIVRGELGARRTGRRV